MIKRHPLLLLLLLLTCLALGLGTAVAGRHGHDDHGDDHGDDHLAPPTCPPAAPCLGPSRFSWASYATTGTFALSAAFTVAGAQDPVVQLDATAQVTYLCLAKSGRRARPCRRPVEVQASSAREYQGCGAQDHNLLLPAPDLPPDLCAPGEVVLIRAVDWCDVTLTDTLHGPTVALSPTCGGN